LREPIIKLKDISFGYDSRLILNALNLEIYEGEKIGLIGPNGSGKTTLLQIIIGLLKPHRGTVEIFEKIRVKERDFTEIRHKIGFLFQNSDNQLFCPTVKEDIAFGPLNLGKTKQEAMKIVRETCKILGLEGFEDRITYKLSEGEKKLVALATVIAMNPLCFLLDEPSAGLNENTTEKILSFIKTTKKTFLIVSHNKEFLKEVADKIFLLKDGRIKY
jgi:cobalt/nickel transport system ATP-binding protein